jgi:hypothetical protein
MTSAVEYQVVLSIGSEQMEGSYSFRGTVKVLKFGAQIVVLARSIFEFLCMVCNV